MIGRPTAIRMGSLATPCRFSCANAGGMSPVHRFCSRDANGRQGAKIREIAFQVLTNRRGSDLPTWNSYSASKRWNLVGPVSSLIVRQVGQVSRGVARNSGNRKPCGFNIVSLLLP